MSRLACILVAPGLGLATLISAMVCVTPSIEAWTHGSGSRGCERVSAITVNGDLMYLGNGPRLTILDLNSAAVLSRSEDLSAPIREIGVADSIALTALGDAGLALFDVTDPTAPKKLELSTSVATAPADRVVVRNHYAYTLGDPVRAIVGNPAYLQVIDLSDPATTIGRSAPEALVAGEAYDIAFDGDAAYVAGYMPLLTTLDASNPREPTTVGSFDLSRVGGLAIAARGGYVYLTNELARALDVIDVSDPATTRRVASYPRPDLWPPAIEPPNRMLHTTPDGHLVALSWDARHESYQLVVFDLSDPTIPFGLGAFRFRVPDGGRVPGRLRAAAVETNVYVPVGEFGVHVIDVSDPTAPALTRVLCA